MTCGAPPCPPAACCSTEVAVEPELEVGPAGVGGPTGDLFGDERPHFGVAGLESESLGVGPGEAWVDRPDVDGVIEHAVAAGLFAVGRPAVRVEPGCVVGEVVETLLGPPLDAEVRAFVAEQVASRTSDPGWADRLRTDGFQPSLTPGSVPALSRS